MLAAICEKFGIPADNIIGHRDVYPLLSEPVAKTCPGQHLYDLLPYIRQRVAEYLA